MTSDDIIFKLREGPVELDNYPNRETLAVHIHKLRERGFGIRLRKAYVLLYEPE